jgi:hypothetical protein
LQNKFHKGRNAFFLSKLDDFNEISQFYWEHFWLHRGIKSKIVRQSEEKNRFFQSSWPTAVEDPRSSQK